MCVKLEASRKSQSSPHAAADPSRCTKLEPQPHLRFHCSTLLQNAAVARVWGTSCAQTRTTLQPQQRFHANSIPAVTCLACALPVLCYSLLPRRNGRSPLDPPRQPQGARMACETTLCVILQTAHERLYRGSDIRLLRHSIFLMFSNNLCAKYA